MKNNRGYFLAGEIIIDGKKERVVCFKRDKRNDKEPDWGILKARGQNEGFVTQKIEK